MVMLPALSAIFSTSVSRMPRCTSPREPATQLWPDAPKFPAINPLVALSRSASSNTRMGDLPPSSSVVTAKFSAEFRITWRAVSGPPVKAMRATSGWRVRGMAQFSASPVMTETTPGGKPASSISRANSSIGAGAISDAFRTTLHPAASAGPSLVAARNICAFHGTTAATTPIGSRRVKTCMSGLSIGSTAPSILSASPAK